MKINELSNALIFEKEETNVHQTNIKKLIDKTLLKYPSISLPEIDQILLMNRIDAKYAFPVNRLPELLARASDQYKVLEIKGHRAMPYSSIYLDTENLLLYHHHLCGKANRYKVRYRTYETTMDSFLEVKCTTAQERTEKFRIPNTLTNKQPDQSAIQFLSFFLTDSVRDLRPVLNNKFIRITLTGLESSERITLDFNITFKGNDNTMMELPYLAVAEVKKETYSVYSPFMNILKQMQIRPTGFSKYCIGSVLLRKMPKENLLKPKLLMLQKIKDENSMLTHA